jgi:hypothetical protein
VLVGRCQLRADDFCPSITYHVPHRCLICILVDSSFILRFHISWRLAFFFACALSFCTLQSPHGHLWWPSSLFEPALSRILCERSGAPKVTNTVFPKVQRNRESIGPIHLSGVSLYAQPWVFTRMTLHNDHFPWAIISILSYRFLLVSCPNNHFHPSPLNLVCCIGQLCPAGD